MEELCLWLACCTYLLVGFRPLFLLLSRHRLTSRVDLDRTNLGNARLQGLPQDALGGDNTGILFDWVNSAFFFSYVSHYQSLFLFVLPDQHSASPTTAPPSYRFVKTIRVLISFHIPRSCVKFLHRSSPNFTLLVYG